MNVAAVAATRDAVLQQVLASPAMFGEVFLVNRDGSPRVYRSYQVEDIECRSLRVAHLDGRDVGKTINLSTLALWYAFTSMGKSVLVAAPYQGHLDTIIDEIEFQIDHSEILRASIARNTKGNFKIKRQPYYEIEFANGSRIHFRPSGERGSAFRSLHVEFLLVDEAAWLPEDAWKALRQCLKTGGVFRVYSTPNGLRDTTYYRITEGSSWRVFRWPSWMSPDWTADREEDLLEFYGGRDTPGWQHEVAGEHGAPSYAVFRAEHVMRALAEVSGYRKVVLTGDMFDVKVCDQCEDVIRKRVEDRLNLAGGHGLYWLGGDLGYTSDPTELLLFDEGEDGVMTLVLRVHAEHVAYPIVAEVVALIDRVYSPLGIGLDKTGVGVSVVQDLLCLDKYKDRRWDGRLIGYDFGGSLDVGQDENGQPVSRWTKEHMTELINVALYEHRMRLPKHDHQIEDQLCTQTYTITERRVVYSKRNDHIIDAMRCAFLRRSQERSADQYNAPTVVMDSLHIAHLTRPLP